MNCEGEDNNGHAIEGDTNGQGLFEGCVFKDVKQTVVDDFKGHLFSVGSTSVPCRTSLVIGKCRVSAEIHTYWRYFESYIIITLVLAIKSGHVSRITVKRENSSAIPTDGSSSSRARACGPLDESTKPVSHTFAFNLVYSAFDAVVVFSFHLLRPVFF
ncbi:hypothetical protein FJTKL_01573 [Diaporthe vaccinii]|uniref:Uncharacterized protein n=1 Tax=Diaporthe vaccinii TaxID=105482 RepID=A0ABR4E060_9PEZI